MVNVQRNSNDIQANGILDYFLENPRLLAQLLKYIGSANLVFLNTKWSKEILKPIIWELVFDVPYKPFLATCFRRAASYCYREIDLPTPNVNRRGSSAVIRACLLSDRTSLREYVKDLKLLTTDKEWIHAPTRIMKLSEKTAIRQYNRNTSTSISELASANMRLLETEHFADTRILSGGIEQETAQFYLWSLDSHDILASMYQKDASCYHSSSDVLAIGCTDGTVKIWDTAQVCSQAYDADYATQVDVIPTGVISHRSSIGSMVPFIRTRSRDRVGNVYIDSSEGVVLQLATSLEDKGDVNVWDVSKGEIMASISSSKIFKSSLPRALKEERPHITSLMLIRNTLVCGSSTGFIRVFDLRSGRLTHRLAGHPEAVIKTDTKGRVLWSAGTEGSVRWWGGKSAKILPKSTLCEGKITALEMDDAVVVAGYAGQGMEAWDVRTQQSLCTFSNASHGGVRSVQFNCRNLLTVSQSGQAALWRWYDSNPVHWFNPPDPSSKFVSGALNSRHLVLGTSNGDVLQFDRNAHFST